MSPLAAQALAQPGPSAAAPSVTAPGTSAELSEAESTAPKVRLVRPEEEAAPPEAATSPAPRHGYLPDPPALSGRAWWAYDIRYDRGVITAGSPALQCLKQPRASARRLGRFAFELWIGAELIDRIRFDFPLLAGQPPRVGPRRPLHEEPSFAPGARVSTRILVPASPRATRAQILDRATGETIPVAWPPEVSSGHGSDAKDGGASQSNPMSAACGNGVFTSPATPTPPAR